MKENRTDAQATLDRIEHSEKVFRAYRDFCDRIDRVYSARDDMADQIDSLGLTDKKYDLFWSSIEVLKPAIYAKPPQVVVKPRFSDANATDKLTAEMLERVVNSEFERGHLNEAMLLVRDDLAILNRGVLWLTLDDDDGKAVCSEWLDREDFAHDAARCWQDVTWVARRAWMTQEQMKERFTKHSGDAYLRAFYTDRRVMDENDRGYTDEVPEKAAVWEVWDRDAKRVRWVTEGVDEYLDDADPHLNLRDFFPCPRPAYGTLNRRTLIPVPDYRRYQVHLDQINEMTRRIYELLDRVRMRGLVAGGGDVGNAVESAMKENDASSIIIPVPGAALLASGGAANMVQWIPLDMLAMAIQGLIDARERLFGDFDRLSGISDIMRGETQAEETLGAQRLKSQYGSIRVREKKDELIRLARDASSIAGEIICDNFSQKQLLEIAQMEIPTRKEVEKSIKDLQGAAKGEMAALTKQFKEMVKGGGEVDPAQVQQQLQQAQQQIAEKYAPEFQQLGQAVVIEDVMELVRDQRGRSLTIDIETDSTVMTDEIAEKSARSEFLNAFSGAVGAAQPLMMAGEAGAKLAGGILKFAMQPFNVSRDLDAMIDEFVEAAPEMAAAMGDQGGDTEGLVEAQNKLAEAEGLKAQAAMEGVKAKAQLDQAEMQRKMTEMQQKAASDQAKMMGEAEKLRQAAELNAAKAEEAWAKVDNIRAMTMKALSDSGIAVDNQALNEFKSLKDIEFREADQSMKVAGMVADQQARQTDQAMSAQDRERAALDGDRAHERAERGEQRADRQQEFTEQQGPDQ